MSQRNPMNERYQKDGHTGSTRKSAASAKPKTKAAASVTVGTRKKTPQERKAEQKAARKEATERQREIDRKYYKPDTARYKKLRKIWWGCIVGGVVCVIIAWLLRTFEPAWIATAILVLAYVLIILAFFIDFRSIRKERRKYQQKMIMLEQMQERAQRQKEMEARQHANKGKKGGKKNVSAAQANKADAEQSSEEQNDSAAAEGAPAKKGFGFFRKKAPTTEASADVAAQE